MHRADKNASNCAADTFDAPNGMEVLRTICPICFCRLAVQFLFCCVADKPLIYNEADDDPDSKSSSAESEAINLIIFEMIAA